MRTASIDLTKYKQFWTDLKQKLSDTTQLLAVVKSNAYGLGAIPLATFLQGHHLVNYLGIATPQEGAQLREAGITLPMLIFSEPEPKDIPLLLTHHCDQIVYTPEFIQELGDMAHSHHTIAQVHLKIDTGMGRIGCLPQDTTQLVQDIQAHPGLALKGICTHFSCADEPENSQTQIQFQKFTTLLNTLNLHPSVIRHCANSAATSNFPQTHLDMVRVGIDSYTPILTLSTRVQSIKSLPKGHCVSYGCTYTAPKDTRIAIIEWGYADGLPRHSKGDVLIRNQRYPIVGRVCMDLMMVDIGQDTIQVGDEVILVGTQGQEAITLEEFSTNATRIPYESLLGIGPRVHRHYSKI